MAKKIGKVYLWLMLAFLYLPIFVLIIFSFNESRSRNSWGGFSLVWYRELFNNPNIGQALFNTLSIAVISTIVATIIGTMAAFGINTLRLKSKRVFIGITNLPVFMPEIVTGISLMLLFMFVMRFLRIGSMGYVTLLLAHISFNVSYVALAVLPRLRMLDKNLFEAATDLGATPMQGFIKVILPCIKPGIITGALLAFTLSIDDFIVSFFTTGEGVMNLSIFIFTQTRRGVNPSINALSTLMFATVMILLYIINRRDKKLEKTEKELQK